MLASALVLGGVVAPVGSHLLNTSDVVHAQENNTRQAVISALSDEGELQIYIEYIPIGVMKQFNAPSIEGYEVYRAVIGNPDGTLYANGQFFPSIEGVSSVTLPEGWTSSKGVAVDFYYKRVTPPADSAIKSLTVNVTLPDGNKKSEKISLKKGETYNATAFTGYDANKHDIKVGKMVYAYDEVTNGQMITIHIVNNPVRTHHLPQPNQAHHLPARSPPQRHPSKHQQVAPSQSTVSTIQAFKSIFTPRIRMRSMFSRPAAGDMKGFLGRQKPRQAHLYIVSIMKV